VTSIRSQNRPAPRAALSTTSYEVVKAALAGGADVHAGTLAYCLKAPPNRDRTCVVGQEQAPHGRHNTPPGDSGGTGRAARGTLYLPGRTFSLSRTFRGPRHLAHATHRPRGCRGADLDLRPLCLTQLAVRLRTRVPAAAGPGGQAVESRSQELAVGEPVRPGVRARSPRQSAASGRRPIHRGLGLPALVPMRPRMAMVSGCGFVTPGPPRPPPWPAGPGRAAARCPRREGHRAPGRPPSPGERFRARWAGERAVGLGGAAPDLGWPGRGWLDRCWLIGVGLVRLASTARPAPGLSRHGSPHHPQRKNRAPARPPEFLGDRAVTRTCSASAPGWPAGRGGRRPARRTRRQQQHRVVAVRAEQLIPGQPQGQGHRPGFAMAGVSRGGSSPISSSRSSRCGPIRQTLGPAHRPRPGQGSRRPWASCARSAAGSPLSSGCPRRRRWPRSSCGRAGGRPMVEADVVAGHRGVSSWSAAAAARRSARGGRRATPPPLTARCSSHASSAPASPSRPGCPARPRPRVAQRPRPGGRPAEARDPIRDRPT